MKKLFALSLLLAASASVYAADTPIFKWGDLLDGSTAAGDQATALVNSDKGGLYGLFTAGSSDDHLTVMLNNKPLFNGSPYSGTSYANNMVLIKFDEKGEAVWNIHTDSGDFASNSGTVAATADGGCVVMLKVRHTDGYFDRPINFVSASGLEHSLDWTAEQRYYRLVVMKISTDGEIEWMNCPEIATGPVNESCREFVAEGFNLYAGCVDGSGNIYIPLNLREPLSFGSTTIEPSNVGTWNGDSQKAAGSFLVVKLTADGEFAGKLELDGDADATYCNDIVFYDGTLYAAGTAAGTSTLKCGDYELTPSQLNSPVVVSFSPDLKVIWAKCLQGEALSGKYAVQNLALTPSGEDLWICGAFNGILKDGENFVQSVQGNLREGLLVHLGAADGKWFGAVSSRDSQFEPAAANTSLTSYMSVLSNPTDPSKVWVYGYAMNTNVGTFIREYDTQTLAGNAERSWNLVTGGGVPTCQAIAYDFTQGICYNTTRGNKAFQPLGGDLSDAPNGWGVYISAFDLPEEMKTELGEVSELSAPFRLIPHKGSIEVIAREPYAIHDLTGRCLARGNGSGIISLPAGIYICNGQKVLVR